MTISRRETLQYATLLATQSLAGAALAQTSPASLEKLARDAFVFAYPMLESYKVMFGQTTQGSPIYRMPVSTFWRGTKLATPEDKDVVRPNNDTIYSLAWLDLRAEPFVLTVPVMADNRYYTFQLVDAYTHNFGYVGTRVTGSGAGKYLLAGPAWNGPTPSGVTRVIRSEGNLIYVLGRTAVNGAQDLPTAQAIVQGYQVEPLSRVTGQPAPPPSGPLGVPPYHAAKASSVEFIGYFNALLGLMQIHPSEQAMIAGWKPLGVDPGRPFDAASLDPPKKAAIETGIKTALADIARQAGRLGQTKNGWQLSVDAFGSRQVMQGKYLLRAGAAKAALFGNDTAEAYYPLANVDGSGRPLDGGKASYVLRFSKAQMPAVRAFWSVTMYGLPDQLLVENSIKRYSIGDRTPGLKVAPDGSLTLYIQSADPGGDKTANWLPAPAGPFSPLMRLYMPEERALHPVYVPPAIRRV